MNLQVFKTPGDAVKALAGFFIEKVNAAIAAKGFCNVVLSGGSSPKSLYQLLASPEYRSAVKWNRIYFFFGDERNVPFEDNNNNGRMAADSLFRPLNIETDHVFYIDTSLGPQWAAADYSKKIEKHFKSATASFDITLLGIGDNAHTASLFPYSPVLQEQQALVTAVYVEELKAYRITMTAALINQSQTIALLVFGKTKAQAVFAIIKGEKNIERYPAQLIKTDNGSTHWFIDQEAAALL